MFTKKEVFDTKACTGVDDDASSMVPAILFGAGMRNAMKLVIKDDGRKHDPSAHESESEKRT